MCKFYHSSQYSLLSKIEIRLERIESTETDIDAALVSGEKSNFQFILRLLNTNVDGKQKIMYALTKIKGVGRRYSNLVCKKADVDLNKRYAILFVKQPMLASELMFAAIVPGRSPPKNSSESSQSSKTQLSTKSQHGSSTGNVISWTARTRRFWQTTWTASYAKI